MKTTLIILMLAVFTVTVHGQVKKHQKIKTIKSGAHPASYVGKLSILLGGTYADSLVFDTYKSPIHCRFYSTIDKDGKITYIPADTIYKEIQECYLYHYEPKNNHYWRSIMDAPVNQLNNYLPKYYLKGVEIFPIEIFTEAIIR